MKMTQLFIKKQFQIENLMKESAAKTQLKRVLVILMIPYKNFSMFPQPLSLFSKNLNFKRNISKKKKLSKTKTG